MRAPRWGREERDVTLAKKHPPYIYGTSHNACLIHKINHVRLRWGYGSNGEYLIRLASPMMIAVTNCHMWWSLDSARAKTCSIPRPDAVLCAACHGLGRNFPKNREHAVKRETAKILKGCVVEAA